MNGPEDDGSMNVLFVIN